MKKLLILLISLLSFGSVYANTQIQMEEYNGVYRIPCTLNGAKMKFIFDTGASNVCLSLSMAEYLLDNDFISTDDIIGTGSSSVADGRIVDHVIINIRDIEIAGYHLNNVQAVVIDGQNSPLLMGQSAIQKLGPIKIHGNILEIESNSNDEGLTEAQIQQMFDEAYTLYNNKSYNSAKELYKTLYEYHLLSDMGLMILSDCCSRCNEDALAISYMNSVKDVDKLIQDGYDFYNTRGLYYYYGADDNKAISDFERAELKGVYDYKKSYIYRIWGTALLNLNRYSQAGDKLSEALNYKASELGVTTDFLMRDCMFDLKKKEKSVKDEAADEIFFAIFKCAHLQGKFSDFDFNDTVIRWAYKGNKVAQKYCDNHNINYTYLYNLNPYN